MEELMPHIESILAQAGLNRSDPTGAISTPIYQTSTFRHPSLGTSTGFDYTRSSNPTRLALEEMIASLENGSRAFAFASGMAALTAVLTLFKQGDHFVVSDDLYGGTYRLFEEVFSRFGITAGYVDCSDPALVEQAIRPETRAILVETPTNPLMKIADLAAISSIAQRKGILHIVDNTFMTPFCQRPLELGADIVVHSGTKFLSGHNDVVCGFAIAKTLELAERIGFIQNATGAILSPSDSWLVIRGLKTLALRIDRSQQNAAAIAAWLKNHPSVEKVFYPGLPEHKGFETQQRQASGAGSMISFTVKDQDLVETVINSVKLISFAESLGGCETLITYPAVQTHGAIPADIRRKTGVTDNLLRLSIGIEHVDDLIADLDTALRR
jgi:cystathionine beta-lyase/cystathionine gamma-synthase